MVVRVVPVAPAVGEPPSEPGARYGSASETMEQRYDNARGDEEDRHLAKTKSLRCMARALPACCATRLTYPILRTC
jgi:hypothetical protein